MTAEKQQLPTAVGEHTGGASAAMAAPQATGRPVATVAAAAQTAATRSRAFARLPQAAGVSRAAPSPVAITAPVAAPVARPVEPPRERPTQQDLSELPVLRIVCWQLALVLAFLAIGRPWPVLLALLAAAAALLGCTAVRVRGQWLSDELTRRARLLLRRRDGDLPEAQSGQVLLRTLARNATVRSVELAGAAAGVLSRCEELLAVLRPVDADPAALTELALSGALLADAGEPAPAVRLQLVLHRGPRNGEPTRAWLAVRVLREPNFAEDAELLVALNNTVRRLHRKLRGCGVAAAALTERELLSTLVALTHTGPGRGVLREERRYWRAGPISQVGVRLSGLGERPLRARVHALHQVLSVAPGVACTIAVTVPEHAAVVRVAGTTEVAVDVAADRLRRMPPPGTRLDRMDCQHGPAVAASLPIGGTL